MTQIPVVMCRRYIHCQIVQEIFTESLLYLPDIILGWSVPKQFFDLVYQGTQAECMFQLLNMKWESSPLNCIHSHCLLPLGGSTTAASLLGKRKLGE